MERGGRRGQKLRLLVSMLVLKVLTGASSESMAENAEEHWGCMVATTVGCFDGWVLKCLTFLVKLLCALHGPGWFRSAFDRSSHD